MPIPEDEIRALRSQAAMFPAMAKLRRDTGQNEIGAMGAYERAVRARTGVAPSMWEIVDALSEPGTGFDRANAQRNNARVQAELRAKLQRDMSGIR